MSANPTNWTSRQTGPTGEKIFFSRPQVFVAAEEPDPIDLQNTINNFIDVLATPLTPDVKYTLTAIEYSNTGTGNSVTHGALVNYTVWTAT